MSIASIINFSLIGSAALFIGYLALKDHASFNKGEHNDYKSTVVSIGVLGTFGGIFVGLFNFDPNNIKESVPLLLEGLKFAFATSVFGMAASVLLTIVQKQSNSVADDEIGALNSINSKLEYLSKLEHLSFIRDDTRTQLDQTRLLRSELEERQKKAQDFLEEQFEKTNLSLEKAVETLSEGATAEIIKALENVIADFNQNLTEQFGENFTQLNEACLKLVEWQEEYRSIVTESTQQLTTINESLKQSSESIEAISSRNVEVQKVYDELQSIIGTFDTQVKSLTEQLASYAELGDKAKVMFEVAEQGFGNLSEKMGDTHESLAKGVEDFGSTIQKALNSQAEAMAEMTADIKRHLPDSLGELEKTLTGLTQKFADDYEGFLRNYQRLTGVAS